MWIILRVFVFFVVAITRLSRRLSPPKVFGERNGTTFYQVVRRSKHHVSGYQVGVEFPVPVLFRLHGEAILDKKFKSLGFSTEMQTGDPVFDEAVYIASDHPAIGEYLAANPEARRLSLEAVQGFNSLVYADGQYLWFKFSGNALPTDADMVRVEALRNAFQGLGKQIRLRVDPFTVRVALAEALTYTVALSALISLVENKADDYVFHLDLAGLVVYGLLAGALLLGVLMLAIKFIVGKSSRGHRIILESAFVLMISLPFTGIDIVSKVNRNFDEAPPIVIRRQVVSANSQMTVWRGRRRYFHSLDFADAPMVEGKTLPRREGMTLYHFQRSPHSGFVYQKIHRGYLGLKWYRAGFSRDP
jgi:hypothetical protein